MANYKIVLGQLNSPIAVFDNASLVSVSGETGVDLVGDELTIDRLNPTAKYVFIVPRAYSPTDYGGILTKDGKIYCCHFEGQNLALNVPYGTKLTYYRDEKIIGTFYVETIERTSRDFWQISAMSIIGLYDKQIHKGGVYTGELFVDVLAEIIDCTAYVTTATGYSLPANPENFNLDIDVADMKVHGYLPYASKRGNLHQLLFAAGASLTRDENAQIHIKYLRNLTEQPIEDSRIFIGGSVKYDAAATGVELTEHVWQWVYNEEPREVYDNTDAYAERANKTLVVFSEPVKVDTLTTEGNLTVDECGETYAIVSGKGVLRGVPYVHLSRKISKHIEDSSIPANVKTVTEATLVCALNSENVLERLFDFYTNAVTVKGQIIQEEEKPGNAYEFHNTFKELERGILTNASFKATSFTKANCEFITGYSPCAFGNNYNNSALLTGSGVWIVPESVRNSDFPFIRIVLVGGGQGGQGGFGGLQGRGAVIDYVANTFEGKGSGKGGKGGDGGLAGQGGKVFSIAKLDVRNVAKIAYSCGKGGKGGEAGKGGYNDTEKEYSNPGDGELGGDTTIILHYDTNEIILALSSANGVILPHGVKNLALDEVYGLSGIDGVAGANGGNGGNADGSDDGTDGEDVVHNGIVYKGGKGSSAAYAAHSSGSGLMEAQAGGGGGGGAALGADGDEAQQPAYAAWQERVWGGYGGKGADAAITPEDADAYGQGGDGGHGGGGGGSGGSQNWTPIWQGIHDGAMGPGGDATKGADGGDGCVGIYY